MRQLYALAVDETEFLLEAVGHYCSTCCPLTSGVGYCPMVTWRESVHTGAIDRVCRASLAEWRERLGLGRGIGLVQHAGVR